MENKTENEQKKEFLQGYQIAKRDVARLEEQLAELRINKLSPAAMIGDGMPHGSNMSDLSAYAAKIDEIEREIIAARYKRVQAYQRVQRAVEAVEDERERTLLTYRYLRGMRWTAICEKMEHSWQHIHRIHAAALKNFSIM